MVYSIVVYNEDTFNSNTSRHLHGSLRYLHFFAHQKQKELPIGAFGVHEPHVHNGFRWHHLHDSPHVCENYVAGADIQWSTSKICYICYHKVGNGYPLWSGIWLFESFVADALLVNEVNITKQKHFNLLHTKIYRCYMIWSNLYVVTGPAVILVLATGNVDQPSCVSMHTYICVACGYTLEGVSYSLSQHFWIYLVTNLALNLTITSLNG